MAVNFGQGTVLKATISSVLTAIAQVLEITGPEVNVGSKDKTNLGDVSKRKRPQLPDSGPVSFSIQYDPADATHTFLTTQVNTWPQPLEVWEVDFNTGSPHKASFLAFLSKFGPKGMNEEDNLEADCELVIDGLVTWT
jgi:hypothetical protein